MEVALIGYGYWGKILERYIQANKKFDLRYIYVRSEQKGDLFTNNLKNILNNDRISAIFICVNTEFHIEYVKKALENGKHVFCEKPLALAHQNIRELVCLKERLNSLKVYVDYIYLTSPSIRKMKEKIGEVGDIKYITFTLAQYGRFYKESVYESLASHCISILCYWFDIKDINAITCNKMDGMKDSSGIVQAGTIHLSIGEVPCDVHVSVLSHKKMRFADIWGTKGSLHFDMLNREPYQFYKYDGGNRDLEESMSCDENNNLRIAISDFYDCCVNDKQDNFDRAVLTQEILQRILSDSNTKPM